MKNIFAFLILFILLLTSCSVYSGNPSKDTATEASSLTTDVQETATPVANFDNVNSNTFTFRKAFPDFALANTVAQAFGKEIDSKTSAEELASLTGEFAILNYWDENGKAWDCADLTGIGYLKGLTEFSCYKNSVTKLPPEIKELKNLKVLNLLKAYLLKTIPPEIGELENLVQFRLDLTGVVHLPKEIGKLKNLQSLSLGAGPLSGIPDEIGNLTNLEYLDLHSTNVKTLPDSICNLTHIKELDISYLELTALPENLGNLTQLESLNLFSNNLKELPKSMSNLKNLKWMNIYDNFDLSESYKNFIPNQAWILTESE